MPKYIITYVRTMTAECEYATLGEAAKHADAVCRQFPAGEVTKLSIYVDGYTPPVDDPEREKRRTARENRYKAAREKTDGAA